MKEEDWSKISSKDHWMGRLKAIDETAAREEFEQMDPYYRRADSEIAFGEAVKEFRARELVARVEREERRAEQMVKAAQAATRSAQSAKAAAWAAALAAFANVAIELIRG